MLLVFSPHFQVGNVFFSYFFLGLKIRSKLSTLNSVRLQFCNELCTLIVQQLIHLNCHIYWTRLHPLTSFFVIYVVHSAFETSLVIYVVHSCFVSCNLQQQKLPSVLSVFVSCTLEIFLLTMCHLTESTYSCCRL